MEHLFSKSWYSAAGIISGCECTRSYSSLKIQKNPDNNYMLSKNVFRSQLSPMWQIFNFLLNLGIFFYEIKFTWIEVEDLGNFRLISVLHCIAKIYWNNLPSTLNMKFFRTYFVRSGLHLVILFRTRNNLINGPIQ